MSGGADGLSCGASGGRITRSADRTWSRPSVSVVQEGRIASHEGLSNVTRGGVRSSVRQAWQNAELQSKLGNGSTALCFCRNLNTACKGFRERGHSAHCVLWGSRALWLRIFTQLGPMSQTPLCGKAPRSQREATCPRLLVPKRDHLHGSK